MYYKSSRMLHRPLFYLTILGLAAMLGACSSSTTTNPPAVGTLVVPTSVNFGSISSGKWYNLAFSISNSSSDTIIISGCSFGGGSFAGSLAKDTVDASRFPLTLGPSKQDSLHVQFNSAISGTQTIVDTIHFSMGTLTGQTVLTVVTANGTTYFTQTNLVSDIPVTPAAAHIDPLLQNPWGLVMGTGGHPWMSDNSSNTSTFYDTSGSSASSITIPLPNGMPGGAPSGIVGAFGGEFFVFSTEDGTIAGWKGGAAATIISDSSASHAVYKGLAVTTTPNQLYATDFHNNAINVFNPSFGVVNSFTDHTLPAGYGPFGIQNINDTLYVTFARQDYIAHDDSAGASIGYVDRFLPNGTMIGGHFASGGNLNSPWGIAQAPASWTGAPNAILIGNFGDGKITAYDDNGNLLGQLQSSAGNVISIPGLWALSFNAEVGADPNKLFFTAGPDNEAHGIFGYLYP
jgi:uncharacterized protein (TIGR03118 family)